MRKNRRVIESDEVRQCREAYEAFQKGAEERRLNGDNYPEPLPLSAYTVQLRTETRFS